MKDIAIKILVIIALCVLLQSFLNTPWWTVYIVPSIVAFMSIQKESKAVLVGFLSILIFWSVSSLAIDQMNDSLLSSKIGALLGVGTIGLILITGLLGGIIGGLGAWIGTLGHKILANPTK